MSNPPQLVARLIGINKYNNYPDLKTAADINADNLEKFLKEKFEGDIKSIKDGDATRDNIIKELTLLQETFERNKAILFFFSGFGGETSAGTSIICPADIGKDKDKDSPGITDQTLIQMFDNISRARGNNIVSNLNFDS